MQTNIDCILNHRTYIIHWIIEAYSISTIKQFYIDKVCPESIYFKYLKNWLCNLHVTGNQLKDNSLRKGEQISCGIT